MPQAIPATTRRRSAGSGIRAVLAGAALLFGAGPIAAACPVAADLARGIRIGNDSGGTELFRSGPDGLVQVDYQENGEARDRNWFYLGAYWVQGADLDPRSDAIHAERSTDIPRAALPQPAPGAVWHGETRLDWMGDETIETVGYVFGAPESIDIGECSYEVLPLRYSYGNAEGSMADELLYFPALGFAWRRSVIYLTDNSVWSVSVATSIVAE